MDEIGNEVFVVAVNRRDGRLPDATKIARGEIFHDVADAQDRLGEMSDHYGVYRALIRMESRLDSDTTPEDRKLELSDLTSDDLRQLMWAMYNSGRIDGRNGTELTDGQVYEQIRDDVADFLENVAVDPRRMR